MNKETERLQKRIANSGSHPAVKQKRLLQKVRLKSMVQLLLN